MAKRKASDDEDKSVDEKPTNAKPKLKARNKHEVCDKLRVRTTLINRGPRRVFHKAKVVVKGESDFEDQLVSDEDQAPLAKKAKQELAQS